MGPCGITHGVLAQFLGAWKAKKKRGGFLLLSCIHYYINNFQELNLGDKKSTATSKDILSLLCG
jgi:hypothetical protein